MISNRVTYTRLVRQLLAEAHGVGERRAGVAGDFARERGGECVAVFVGAE